LLSRQHKAARDPRDGWLGLSALSSLFSISIAMQRKIVILLPCAHLKNIDASEVLKVGEEATPAWLRLL